MKLEYAAKTDVGKVRDHNEDSYGIISEEGMFFVCDGMGGHAAGDYASQNVVATMTDLLALKEDIELKNIIPSTPDYVTEIGRKIASYIMLANRRLFHLAVMYPKLRGMGTTMTSVCVQEGYINMLNVGDSRVYRYRNSNLEQLSVDHSWVEELRQDGEIAETEIQTFKENNVITRAMGTSGEAKVDWKLSKAKKDDIYLLCSDGLCGEIDDESIRNIIDSNKDDLDKTAEELINAANDSGGADNTTVILLRIQEDIEIDLEQIKLDEIITLSTNKEIDQLMDSFINKKYPSESAVVPKGVVKEKQKIYSNPLLIAVLAVFLIIGGILVFSNPWRENTGALTEELTRGDLLVRTSPAGATVKLLDLNRELISQKTSPADFLALMENKYIVEIQKTGYEDKSVEITSETGKQTVLELDLVEHAKLKLTLGGNSGFEGNAQIFINDKLCKYYGQSLTVQRIGMVGKSITVERAKEYKIQVGDAVESIYLSSSTSVVNIKLENGEIIIE